MRPIFTFSDFPIFREKRESLREKNYMENFPGFACKSANRKAQGFHPSGRGNHAE
jgi:hypothetical protein